MPGGLPFNQTMSAQYDSRDAAHSTTSQLLFGSLFGNMIAVLCVIAFRPFDAASGQARLILGVGVLSLVAVGLLCLASVMRRRAKPWWIAMIALNVTQIARLVPAVVAIGTWAGTADFAGVIWSFLFVPFIAFLSALGVVTTLREVRKGRRRRLAHAA